MYKSAYIAFLIGIFCISYNEISAQSDSLSLSQDVDGTLIIESISLEGNKRTRAQIIYRELDMEVGDTILMEELDAYLEFERNKIFNTQLFNVVEARYDIADDKIKIHFKMEERWYIWPSINVDLGDRNFNEWILQRGARFNRLVFGVTFHDKNFRGRKENLKVKLQFGFTRKFEIFYDVPYINKNQKTGIGSKFSYSDNKSVAWQVFDHKLDYFDGESIQRRRLQSNVYVTRRSEYFGRHTLEAGYNHQWIGDTLVNLNPQYFGDSLQNARFFTLVYSYSWDKRNIAYYATKGHYLGFALGKIGLGIYDNVDLWELVFQGAKYYGHGKKFYSAHYGSFKLSGPEKQPFFLYRGLGYGKDVLRGFDLYVINANYYVTNKNELKYKLLSFKKKFDFIPVRQFSTLPVDIYFKVFADFGYADDRNTRNINARYSNKFLSGYGAGLDIATFYDLVFRTEYSINQDGETYLFLNLKAAF